MKWCPLTHLIRAIGWPGWYKPPVIKIDGETIDNPKALERKADEVVHQVELLEWEVRRAGLGR